MGRRLKRKPRGRQGVEWQHRKASEIFKDDEKAACTHGRNRNAAAGEIGAVGNAGREAERGGDFEGSGSLIGVEISSVVYTFGFCLKTRLSTQK